jgi:hypothetical protein
LPIGDLTLQGSSRTDEVVAILGLVVARRDLLRR